jgi:hypothetical protein
MMNNVGTLCTHNICKYIYVCMYRVSKTVCQDFKHLQLRNENRYDGIGT